MRQPTRMVFGEPLTVHCALKPILVPRVLELFGQQVSAWRDSGIMDLNYFFDWSHALQWQSDRKSVSNSGTPEFGGRFKI